MSCTFTLTKKRVVPVKKIIDYYGRSKQEKLRMKRAILSALACIRWRNK